jgi:sugar lactone lactonase YvrE
MNNSAVPSPRMVSVSSSKRLSHSILVAAAACLALAISPFAQGQATNFGSSNLGVITAATAVPVTLTASAKLGTVSVLTQGVSLLDFTKVAGGTCTVNTTYSSGASCTVSVKFRPGFVGLRTGAVVLLDKVGNVIGSSPLEGTGSGHQISFLPSTESTVTTSVSGSGTVAIDGNGNLYVADGNHNRVLKETLSAGTYTETIVPTGILSSPYAVVVDGAGNLYIADADNNRVLKETLTGTGFTQSTVPSSALNYPTDVAVDANGSIYIADLNNNRVVVETKTSGVNVETVLPFSNLDQPIAVAVDASGNVYVTDAGNNQILVATPAAGSYTISTLATSALNYPGAIRVDANGNIYIADTFNQRVLKETSRGAGVYVESVVSTSALDYPYGLAVDATGNVFVSDCFGNRVIKADISDPPSLSFATTAEFATSTDSPKVVTVSNYGNTNLTFSALSFPIDFPQGSTTGQCTATKVLASNASCKLTIDFTPQASLNGANSAPLSETVSLTTNTGNNAGTVMSIVTTGTETLP